MITCVGAGPGDAAYLTRRVIELIESAELIAGFDAVVNLVRAHIPAHAEVGAKIAAKMLARLKWPRAEAEQVSDMVRNHMTFKDVQAMRVSTLKRLMARPTFADELQLHRADCLGSHGMLDNYRFLLRRGRELGREEIRPKPLARGQDVMALGVPEGPEVGRLLRALEEKQLEGELRTREEALKWLQEQVAGSRK